jgi:hypothetical protein
MLGDKMRQTKYLLILIFSFALISSTALGKPKAKVTIVEPKSNEILSNPVKICMKIEGMILEHEDNGVREGYGHHHIMFSSLPTDLDIPIAKNDAIHMSDGSKCKTVNLVSGQHVIRALFSYADHVPYNPAITDKVLIHVK